MGDKRRVTFTADTAELFDMLAKVGDGGAHLGVRLVAALLAPPDWSDLVGMGVYGVEVEDPANG